MGSTAEGNARLRTRKPCQVRLAPLRKEQEFAHYCAVHESDIWILDQETNLMRKVLEGD